MVGVEQLHSILYDPNGPIAGLHLGRREGAFAPLKTEWPPDVVCIVTYIILKRFMNRMMSHHIYLIKIKFLH